MRVLAVTPTCCLGLLAGAMLLIGGAIVPYWFSLEPSAFAAWFVQNSSLLAAVMLPLGGATTLLPLATAFQCWRSSSPARGCFATAAALASVVAVIYLVEHAALNAAIESGSLSPAELVSARESWRAWHCGRIGAGTPGFLAGLVGLGHVAGVSPEEPAT